LTPGPKVYPFTNSGAFPLYRHLFELTTQFLRIATRIEVADMLNNAQMGLGALGKLQLQSRGANGRPYTSFLSSVPPSKWDSWYGGSRQLVWFKTTALMQHLMHFIVWLIQSSLIPNHLITWVHKKR